MYHAIIIDDEKWVVKSLIATIRDQEYFDITGEFYDGVSGLSYIRQEAPDLAFVDVRLPGLGGLDILQAVQAEHLHTLFIMISGHAEFAYAQKAMFHNAIGYCLKPFSRSELVDAMCKASRILDLKKDPAGMGEAQDEAQDPSVFRPKHLTSSHKSIKVIIEYTEKHFKENISIHDLAARCAINANYASQLFKQETGISYIRYLTDMRIDYAAHLLMHTDETVFSIADQAGYSDYFYFAKVFKKIKGCTPTDYRKSVCA